VADQNDVVFFTHADIISHDPLDGGLVFRFDLYTLGMAARSSLTP
jgi:hypothetical protein